MSCHKSSISINTQSINKPTLHSTNLLQSCCKHVVDKKSLHAGRKQPHYRPATGS